MKEEPISDSVPSPRRRPWIKWVLIIVFGLMAYLVVVGLIFSGLGGEAGYGGSIGLVRLDGAIGAGGDQGLFGGASVTSESLMEQLDVAGSDDSVAAVVIRINSPGGTAAAGEEVRREVERLAKQKPVVASVGDVGASAAYLIASACDTIVASPSSEVGSIGTIVVVPNYEGLFEKIGVGFTIITQGKYKDMGDPSRSLTEEERQILERQSKKVYDTFIASVAEGRELPVSDVEEMASGLTFLGTEGLELGLVDELGNLNDAIDIAATLGKIEGEPEIVEFGQPSLLQLFSGIFSGRTTGFGRKLFGDLHPLSGRPVVK